MVQKGLKVGDLFEDGGRQFKILQIDRFGNYISQYVGQTINYTSQHIEQATKEKPVKKEEEKPINQLDSFNTYTKTEINRLNNAELERVCEKLGLEKSTGMAMKKAIIEKLGL